MAGPSDHPIRNKYWSVSNGQWVARQGSESMPVAQSRLDANHSILIDLPAGIIKDGIVESHDLYSIKGWAIDPYDDNIAPAMAIWVNDVIVDRITCSKVRNDIAIAYGITTFNLYGFEYIVPAVYQSPTNVIRVTLVGSTANLVGTPIALGNAPVTTTTATTTVQKASLFFNIISYSISSGILQYKVTGGDGTPVILTIPGVIGGSVKVDTPYNYTFPSDARNGSRVTGTMVQGGNTFPVDFTTGPGIQTGTTTSSTTAAPPPTLGFDYISYPATPITDKFPIFSTAKVEVTVGLEQQWINGVGTGLSGNIWRIKDKINDPTVDLLRSAVTVRSTDTWAGSSMTLNDLRTPNMYKINTGQGMGPSLYLNPLPYYGQSEAAGQPHVDPFLGYNVLEGDDGGYTAKVLRYGAHPSGNGYNVLVMPVIYSDYACYAYPCLIERWVVVTDNIVDIYIKFTNNRTESSGLHAKQAYLSDQENELPFLYANSYGGRTRISYYDGNAPYTNAAVRTVDVGGGGGMRSATQRMTEGWVAVVTAAGYGIGLIQREPASKFGFFGSGANYPDFQHPNGNSTYINGARNVMWDDQMVWYDHTRIVVGTIADIRTEAYKAENKPPSLPVFRFNKADRLGWSYGTFGDSPVLGGGKERRIWDDGINDIAAKGYWQIHIGASPFCGLTSPNVAYKASDITHIYFSVKYTGPQTQWKFGWLRNGQLSRTPSGSEETYRFPNGLANPAQEIAFTINNTGAAQVIDINVGANAQWIDIINQFYIRPNASGTAASIADAQIFWMNVVNAQPA